MGSVFLHVISEYNIYGDDTAKALVASRSAQIFSFSPNSLVFVTEVHCVFCEVGSNFYLAQLNIKLQNADPFEGGGGGSL
jgi:hypothetical protein